MKKLLLLILLAISLVCLSQSDARVIMRAGTAVGLTTLVYWDCATTTLNTFDATDGSTVTVNGTSFVAGCTGNGIQLILSTDNSSFVATDGNNINLDHGTIEFEFKEVQPPGTYSTFFQLGTENTAFSLFRYGLDTEIMFRIEGVNWQATIVDIFDTACHTIKVSWDTATEYREIWVDGNSQGTDSTSISTPTPATNDFYVGSHDDANGQCEGIIDEFYIWAESSE